MDMLSIVGLILVATVVLGAGIYLMSPEKK